MLSASVQNTARVVVLVSSAFAACLSSSVHSASVISLAPGAQSNEASLRADFHVFAPVLSGEAAAVEQLTLRFTSATTLIRIASKNGDFVVENGGSCIEGRAFARGDTCTILVRFTPQGAGNRLGQLTVEDTADQGAPASIGLGGNGYAPVVSFTPALIATVDGTYPSNAGLLSGAQNLAVDGSDTLYLPDTGNNLVRYIDSSGTIRTLASGYAASGIAVDNFGQVYFAVPATGKMYEVYDYGPVVQISGTGAANCPVSTPCALSSEMLGAPGEMSVDAYNHLFFVDSHQGAAMATVQPIPAMLIFLYDPFPYQTSPSSAMAVDAGDNLYSVWANGGVCEIVRSTLYDAENSNVSFTKIAGGHACGFSGDGGQAGNAELGSKVGQIAFDLAGDMYFSDTSNQRVRRVDYTTGQINTIAGTGTAGYSGDDGMATSAELSGPTGIAVNSQGAVYIISAAAASGSAQVVRKVGPDGMLDFGDLTTESASAPLTIDVANTGNSTLALNNVFITGTNGADFAIDPNTTSCILTAGSQLSSGQSCRIGVIFTLALSETGPRSASLVMLDNSVDSQNVVHLHGYGIAKAADRIFLGDFDQ